MKTLLPLFALAGIASAQVYTPPAQQPAQQQQPASSSSSSGSSAQQKPAASPFGSELPFADPIQESVTWNGKTWNVANTRLIAARFERYLNEPEDNSEDARAYRETLSQILELVSPQHPGGPQMFDAIKLLPRGSSFPGDAKLCDSLSQAIYAAMLSKTNVEGTKKLMAALEDEKKRLINNADVTANGASVGQKAPASGGTAPQGQTRGGSNPRPGTGTDSLEYKEALRRLVEIEAMKKANQAKGEVQILQAKVQYQTLMVQFFLQRRFQHVLIASRFYHQIWKDGDTKLHLDKNSDVSKMFSEGVGMSPTVSALDSLASEAIRDIDKGVEAFQYLLSQNELDSAGKRLTEAYAVGEFMPSIRILPREQKRRILEYVREANKLAAAIEVKDYGTAQQQVEKIQKIAPDFDATKARAAIATFTRVSDMHIMQAKNFAAAGDTASARKEIESAMEVWPQNPKLQEFDRMVETGGALVQGRNDFDRLLSEKNFREIARRQYEFAPAIKGDATREDAFKQIITNLTRIETALGKASEFSKAGQDYGAWEQLAAIREEFPDDPKLGREMELLAPKVADFTKAIDRARQFENRKPRQTGSALTWYLKARAIHPQSSVAEAGIQRMLNDILPEE